MEDWKKQLGKMVYSTNPDTSNQLDEGMEGTEKIDPGELKLRIWLDRKRRKGKAVTLIKGFVGSKEEKELLGKALKKQCGVGGSTKDGEILLQGDQRNKVLAYLKDNGYHQSKIAGS